MQPGGGYHSRLLACLRVGVYSILTGSYDVLSVYICSEQLHSGGGVISFKYWDNILRQSLLFFCHSPQGGLGTHRDGFHRFPCPKQIR